MASLTTIRIGDPPSARADCTWCLAPDTRRRPASSLPIVSESADFPAAPAVYTASSRVASRDTRALPLASSSALIVVVQSAGPGGAPDARTDGASDVRTAGAPTDATPERTPVGAGAVAEIPPRDSPAGAPSGRVDVGAGERWVGNGGTREAAVGASTGGRDVAVAFPPDCS